MAVGDIYPRRNLPPEAENWGRSVEGRISRLEEGARFLLKDTLSQSSSQKSLLSVLVNQTTSVEERTGSVHTLSGFLEFFRDPAPPDPYFVQTWTLQAPEGARYATLYSLGWDVTNVNSGIGGAAFPYVYVRSTEEEASQGWPLFTDGIVDPFGGWQDSPYPVPAVVSGGGVALDFWVLRVDSGGVFSFDLEWPILVQWF